MTRSGGIDDDCIELPLSNIFDPWRDAKPRSVFQKVIWKLLDWFNPVAFFRLVFLLFRMKPDVVLAHNIKGFSVAAWAAPRVLGIRVVQVLHDYYLICSTCALGVAGVRRCATQCFPCRMYSLPKYVLSAGVSDFIGVSGFVAERHRVALGLPACKVQVVNNVRPPMGGAVNRTIGDKAELRVGFIGRIEPAKGIELFLAACARVVGDARFVVAGGSPDVAYRDELKRKFGALRIDWLGQVDPLVFYEQVDCVVVPSVWDEPFPAVAYEPQMFGRVVIASDVGGISEIVEDGVSGFLFPCGDIDALVEIIDRLNADRYLLARVGEVAQAGSDRFTALDQMVDKYEEILLREE